MGAPFGVAGLGEWRRSEPWYPGTTSRSPSTTCVFMCSLEFTRTQPRLARHALLPRHALHPHKRSEWNCCSACTGVAREHTLLVCDMLRARSLSLRGDPENIGKG
jgi:hypothetical protein